MKPNTQKRGLTVWFYLAVSIPAAVLLVSSSDLSLHSPIASAQEEEGGLSVHFKNGKTPDWMAELQSKSARQSPELIVEPASSYWI